MADRPKVVMVGEGFGGLYTAKNFRGVAVDVTLIDKVTLGHGTRHEDHSMAVCRTAPQSVRPSATPVER